MKILAISIRFLRKIVPECRTAEASKSIKIAGLVTNVFMTLVSLWKATPKENLLGGGTKKNKISLLINNVLKSNYIKVRQKLKSLYRLFSFQSYRQGN